MTGAYKLVIMCCIYYFYISSTIFPVSFGLQNDGWCQMELDIVQVYDIRIKIIQNTPYFPARLKRINYMKRCIEIFYYTFAEICVPYI